MLTLMLLRHAKAVQQARGEDFARDLQPQGKVDAAKLGAYLVDIDCVPDFAFVSASVRTLRTFEIVQTNVGRAIPTRFERDLYNATAPQVRDLLKQVPPEVRRLMVVGHNPGIADAATHLARDGDLTDLARVRNRFSPCGLAVVAFESDDWLDARARGGRLDLFVLPEDLASPR